MSKKVLGFLQNGLKQQLQQLLDASKARKDWRRATADVKREPKCEGTRRLPLVAPRKQNQSNSSNGVVITYFAATAMLRSQHAFHVGQTSLNRTETISGVIRLSYGNFGIGVNFLIQVKGPDGAGGCTQKRVRSEFKGLRIPLGKTNNRPENPAAALSKEKGGALPINFTLKEAATETSEEFAICPLE